MGLIKSKKHIGVFHNLLKNGDKVYYVVYKDISTNKRIDLKIGKKSENITESYCHNKRSEIVNNMRLGINPNVVKNRRIAVNIISLDMIADEYYENRKLYMKEVNWKDALSIYNIHIKPYLGNKNIVEITSADIEEIMIRNKAKLANKTINIIIEKIATIFYYAIKKKIFKGINPIIGVTKLPESNERLRFLSKEEINLLLQTSKEHDLVVYIFTYFALSTGARLMTLCNIKVQDLDFTHGFVTLYDIKKDKAVSYKGFIKKDEEFINLLKNHIKNMRLTDFILGERTLIGIRNYIQRELNPILHKLFNTHIMPNDSNDDSEGKAEKRRNKVVIHSLRHTFASQLVINGTPIYTVQKLMNHKDIKMTMRYAKLSQDSGRNFTDNIF